LRRRCSTGLEAGRRRASVALANGGRGAHTERVSDDPILYDRRLAHGPAVRVRRTSEPGMVPVTAVLEVDRRAGTRRESLGGFPPPLMIVEAPSDDEVLAILEPHATDDRLVAGLMRDKGLR
jgi:hypothetical protein